MRRSINFQEHILRVQIVPIDVRFYLHSFQITKFPNSSGVFADFCDFTDLFGGDDFSDVGFEESSDDIACAHIGLSAVCRVLTAAVMRLRFSVVKISIRSFYGSQKSVSTVGHSRGQKRRHGVSDLFGYLDLRTRKLK